jgi:microcystin degradation protein MlrC
MTRVLLANFAQESNSFVPTRSNLDSFRRFYLLFGADVISCLRGGGTEVAGIIAAAEEDGIDLVPLVATYGGTGGPVTNEAFGFMRDRILDGARRHAGEVDGVILALHGAMLTEDLDDPEGELITALRGVLGPGKPIVASLDCHAHMTDRMASQLTALAAYHTHPHVDFHDTGHRAMKLLGRILRGEVRPVMVHRKLPMISPPERHNTGRTPMAEVMGRVLTSESTPGMLSAALFPVQPWLDIPDLGWSVVTVSDGDRALARAEADAIGELALQNRQHFLPENTPIPEALRIARETPGGPIVLADSADSTSAGASGDSNRVLRALLESPVPGPCYLLITDPEAVARCIEAGIRSEVTVEVGGKLVPEFCSPITVTGYVRTISDGRYRTELPPMPADRGRTVVLQIGNISLVISETCVYTWDQECYRSVGLHPAEAKLVLMKSAGGFRPKFETFSRRIIELDSVGPADSNLTRLPWRRVTRPLFPLDSI